ncbi:GNAT family N-acetyltransferase [Chitinolyticbacter meiyuanensis]|uniref:GNAT family N-acetyltransferase n=1 Tax=Chitinolyticbacter meiyuanensis TaxID=682798 RepID=UPI0011E5D896|nr:GNAT family N-acetyltransferase [Chitinolyticbacter meiyuanensis]
MIRIHTDLTELPAADWNRLAGPHPALQHGFLAALEASGCASAASGWQPCHLALWRNERLAAALPLYLKSHSRGEYVFDWAWARAYAEHGHDYYPKLVSAIPFSPLPGPRLLARSHEDRLQLLAAAQELARQQDASSLHLLFCDADDLAAADAAGLARREQLQFHWQRDPAWHDFDDFLMSLSHDKRKKIRQERRKVAAAGVEVEALHGAAITAEHWAFFLRCYAQTYHEHRSSPYLNADFFTGSHAAAPEQWLLFLARRHGQPIACALDLVGPDRLYGRYWGAQWDQAGWVPGLHFELCYYQGIDWAIRHGIAVFEGGAQGEHKLARGFSPVVTHSAHWLAHPGFADAVGRFLAQERELVAGYRDELEMHSPFRSPGVVDR